LRPGDFDRIFQALNTAGVRYLVVDGIAAILHGVNRFTVDVDICLSMTRDNLSRFWTAMAGLGYRPSLPVSIGQLSDLDNIAEWCRDKNLKAIKFWDPKKNLALPLDVVVDAPLGFENAYDRRKDFEYHGYSLPVIGKKDLIEMKIGTGRNKDLDDVEVLRRD